MNKVGIARLLALVFHPVVPGFIVALSTGIQHEGALTARLIQVATLVSGLCLGLPLVAVFVLHRTGRIGDDIFLVERRHRRYLYPVLLVSLVLSGAVFTWHYPFPLARAMTFAALVVSLTMAVANQWLKPSIHCAGLAGIFVTTAWVHGRWGLAVGVLIPVVAWARITTKNHTPLETIVGTALGTVVTFGCCVVVLGADVPRQLLAWPW